MQNTKMWDVIVSVLIGLAVHLVLVSILALLGAIGSNELVLIALASCGGGYVAYRWRTAGARKR